MAVLLPDVPNVVKIVTTGSLNSLPWANTFHVLHSAGNLSQATLDGVASTAHSAYNAEFSSLITSVTQIQKTQAIDISSRTGGFGQDTTPHNGGFSSINSSSNQVALVVSWAITDRYRGGHPRTYFPGMSSANVVSGHLWLDTYRASFETAARAFRTALNGMTIGGLTWSMVCVRYFWHHALLTDPLVRPITQATVRTRVDSMRRRLGKEAP